MTTLPPDLPLLPARPLDSHKGQYGRVLIVGGAVGMAGAAGMAGMAALRSGAGLVSLLVPEPSVPVVASFHPSYMCRALAFDGSGNLTADSQRRLDELVEGASCIGLGPGLGRGPELARLAVGLFRRLANPMVVDADGLNALAERSRPLAGAGGPRVLTPHPGEFARLGGGTARDRVAQQDAAVQLAASSGCTIVLKGYRTLVTDGHQQFHNSTGNPGMATGGTGDVLTGVVTSLIAQGLTLWDAARLGVYVHGLAGDVAAQRFGQVSMTATDVIDCLPAAFQQVLGSSLSPEGSSKAP